MKGNTAITRLLALGILVLAGSAFAQADAAPASGFDVYLPIIANPLEPPVLNPINNSDQDNYYLVSWQSSAGYYVLQQATNPSFSGAIVVYQGAAASWPVPSPGRLPGTYYYRVRAVVQGIESGWSNTQSIVIYPLYVGLTLRWDGQGYLNLAGYGSYQPGTHLTRNFDALTAPDVIRGRNHHWYAPNPLDFDETNWDTFYSVSSGDFLSSSLPSDPAWKWSHPWFLPYSISLANGQTISVGGQTFLVSGPHSGYTAFGQPVQYWELVNRDRFLYHDAGTEWTQYVHAGEAKLRFDAGRTRLLLHKDILRHYYQNGQLTSSTVQYIDNLTAASSFPGSSPTLVAERPAEMDRTAGASTAPAPQWSGIEPGPIDLSFEIRP